MESLIRWKRGDYIKLSRAVRDFNRVINELEGLEYLPELKDYKDVKKNITSRKELNRVIKAMRKANRENISKSHVLASGEEISDWEFKEIKKAERRAFRNIQKERETILKERPSIGMGYERLTELKGIEESFKKFQEKTGEDLKRLKQRIFLIGRTDYKLSRDELFRQNFYTALDGIKNFKNYDILKKELDKIKNPTKFYEYVKKSPVLMDLFLWYKETEVSFYPAYGSNEEAFNSSILFHLDIMGE